MTMADAIPNHVQSVFVRVMESDGASPGSRGDWFLENRLVDVFKKRAFEVFVNNRRQPYPDSTALVEYKLLDIGIEYLGPDTKNEMVNRRAHIHFLGRVVLHTSGQVLFNGSLQARRSGRIALADKQSLENTAVDFTIGKVVTNKRRSSVLQPVVVTVITGVVVYLFYALRSR